MIFKAAWALLQVVRMLLAILQQRSWFQAGQQAQILADMRGAADELEKGRATIVGVDADIAAHGLRNPDDPYADP